MLKYFILVGVFITSAFEVKAADIVRLGNLKLAHCGALSYMRVLAPKYNLKIEERFLKNEEAVFPALANDEIDVAASSVDAAIAARAGNVPAYLVAAIARGGVRLVTGKTSGVRTLNDLEGKKIGVQRGGSQELLLLAELEKAGLTWSPKTIKDVQIVYMTIPKLNQALMDNTIDVMSQVEPQATQAITEGFGVELLKPYDTPIDMPARSLVMSEKFYNKKDVATRFMKLFVEATQAFIDNPELAESYAIGTMFKGNLTAEDYQSAISNLPFTYDITVEQVQTTIDLRQKYNIGRTKFPPIAADWVKLDLLEAAKISAKSNVSCNSWFANFGERGKCRFFSNLRRHWIFSEAEFK